MANENKDNDSKAIVVEFKVSMHCNACERTVAKVIAKFKGVEKFTTEMKRHKVVVTGKIDPQKLLKKLKKKTGKRVEIVENNVKKEEINKSPKDDSDYVAQQGVTQSLAMMSPPFYCCYCGEVEVLRMFSDENPNACLIM